MNKLHIQNISENQYVTQQTVDSDKTNSQDSIRNKQSIASQRHYSSSMSEHSKENISVAEMRDRSAHQTLNCQTDTNSGINVVNEKYSEAYNELLGMPMSTPNKHSENVAEFVIEALHNQRIDFSSIADVFCKKIDAQSNSDTVSTIAYSIVKIVNMKHTDIAAEIIADMVDNGRVDTADRILCSMKSKNQLVETGKILGKIADDGRHAIVFKIIYRSVDQSYHPITNIATASSMLHAMVNAGKTNVVAEIINQMVDGEYTDNAIKVLVYTIRYLEEAVARNIINEISDAKKIDMITKLLSCLLNTEFKNYYDQIAANKLNRMLEDSKERAKTKMLQEINGQSVFAIADMIVEMINNNDIEFALSIFKTIDQKRRPNVLSAMEPNSRKILYNVLKERNVL